VQHIHNLWLHFVHRRLIIWEPRFALYESLGRRSGVTDPQQSDRSLYSHQFRWRSFGWVTSLLYRSHFPRYRFDSFLQRYRLSSVGSRC